MHAKAGALRQQRFFRPPRRFVGTTSVARASPSSVFSDESAAAFLRPGITAFSSSGTIGLQRGTVFFSCSRIRQCLRSATILSGLVTKLGAQVARSNCAWAFNHCGFSVSRLLVFSSTVITPSLALPYCIAFSDLTTDFLLRHWRRWGADLCHFGTVRSASPAAALIGFHNAGGLPDRCRASGPSGSCPRLQAFRPSLFNDGLGPVQSRGGVPSPGPHHWGAGSNFLTIWRPCSRTCAYKFACPLANRYTVFG